MQIITNKIKILRAEPKKQRGATLMLMLVILIVAASAILLRTLNSTSPRIAREQATATALAQARDALISYAISSENAGNASARPGNFPCPDNNAPGTSGYGDSLPSCSAGGGTSIGRLPWKTLGIPEQVDGDGEPLWYVVSDNFRKQAGIINSDTRGTLQIFDRDGITLLTPPGNEAVAIVFAPGSIVGNKQRNTLADKTTASNYLETAKGRNNAGSTGPFIAADKSDSINDRLTFIRTRDFMPVIEKRVAKALQTILQNYKFANGFYPYPASFNSCKDNLTCDSNPLICRGRFPQNAQPANWGGSYAMPVTGGSDWFMANQWYRVIYYSVGSNSLATVPTGCNATLNVSGNNTDALFFMPGTPSGNITRTYTNNNLIWYLEDGENINLDDIYITPSVNSNDQFYVLP